MQKYFKPKPGRYGVETNVVSARVTGNLTDSGTLPVYFAVPYRKAVIGRISVTCSTAVVSAGGAVTATVKKYDKSATADVSLTAATNIKTLTVKENANVAVLTTLTDSQLIVDEGDTLRVDIACASTVDTQPVNLVFSIELLILE